MSQRTIAAALLILLPLLAYLPAIHGQYLWDDDHHLTQNKDLRNAPGLLRIWTRFGLANGGTPQYYPLTHTTFWIQYQLNGLAPLPYHLLNVLLHGISAILAWQILLRLNVPGAFLAAAVWAIHPVNVESVAWITERKNVLSTVFCLLAVLIYLGQSGAGVPPVSMNANQRRDGRFFWNAGAIFLFLLALLSKTTVSVMPVILLLILWWKKELTLRRAAGLLPLIVLGIALGLVTATVERRYVGAVGPDWGLSFPQRILIAGRAIWFYLEKLIWPARLSFSYIRWQIDPAVPWQWLYPLAVVGVVAVAITRPAPRTAILSFLILLFPALGFFNIYPMRYSFVADHFQYLASLPMIALIISFLTEQVPGRLMRVAAPAILIALFIATWNRSENFRDSFTLWRDTIDKTPSSWMARNNLGMALIQRAAQNGSPADLAEAEQLLNETLQLRPDHEWAHFGLGKVNQLRGNLAAAKLQYEQEALIEPQYPPTYFELGMIAMDENDIPTAREMFEHSRDLDSLPPHGRNVPTQLAQTRVMLARLYTAAGRQTDATKMLNEANVIKSR